MFLLVVLLTGLGGLHAGHSPHKVILQTTVPEKISSLDAKGDTKNNVAYIITIGGKSYFLHLKKQSFLSSPSIVYYYDQDDILHSKSLLSQMDCNYNGYVAGYPDSLVTLSTCSGLRGIVQFKNISYGIEPMETVSGFVHKIYEEKNNITNIPLLNEIDNILIHGAQAHARNSLDSTEVMKLLPRYLEMHVVVDKTLFDYLGSDIKTVTQKVVQIIGLANTMFTQLKLSVTLSSIEIWSNQTKISIIGSPENVLLRFLEWKKTRFGLQHRISYLLAFGKLAFTVGSTFPGKICDEKYNVGFALYPEGFSLESYTVIIAQLLGIHLGLTYDKTDTCFCSGYSCIMMPNAVYSWGIKRFSKCSMEEFKYFASTSDLKCLQRNSPDVPVNIQAQRRICGNGIIESNEKCDCGSIKNCTHKKCCHPLTCTLKSGAICGSGECCSQDCKLKPIGVLCRKAADKDCDFNEYCNGHEPYCVPNTFARNGEYCDSGNAFCFGGVCRTFDRQCQKLIKGASSGGSFPCYDEINSRADRYGNCGENPCRYPHMLCGKLVCSWPHKKPAMLANMSAIYAHVREETCVSVFVHNQRIFKSTISTYKGASDRDETFVEDGTICGPDMYCDRMVCKEVRFLKNESLCNVSRDCNNHGICNNLNNCQCEKGFAPPSCTQMKGEFGSVDDGHKPRPGLLYSEKIQATRQEHHFQLIFYISLPVLIIAIAIIISQNKIRELCYRGETESERSVSEESSSYQ